MSVSCNMFHDITLEPWYRLTCWWSIMDKPHQYLSESLIFSPIRAELQKLWSKDLHIGLDQEIKYNAIGTTGIFAPVLFFRLNRSLWLGECAHNDYQCWTVARSSSKMKNEYFFLKFLIFFWLVVDSGSKKSPKELGPKSKCFLFYFFDFFWVVVTVVGKKKKKCFLFFLMQNAQPLPIENHRGHIPPIKGTYLVEKTIRVQRSR